MWPLFHQVTRFGLLVNAIGEKVQVTQEVFTNLVEDAKSSCLGFFSHSPCSFFSFSSKV
jgi:hypothetical protein